MSDTATLAITSAAQVAFDPRSTPGELVGGTIGSVAGPIGFFAGAVIGRMLESSLFD